MGYETGPSSVKICIMSHTHHHIIAITDIQQGQTMMQEHLMNESAKLTMLFYSDTSL